MESKPIGIRVSKAEKARLVEAAKSLGMSLSEFLREAAVARAYRALKDAENST